MLVIITEENIPNIMVKDLNHKQSTPEKLSLNDLQQDIFW